MLETWPLADKRQEREIPQMPEDAGSTAARNTRLMKNASLEPSNRLDMRTQCLPSQLVPTHCDFICAVISGEMQCEQLSIPGEEYMDSFDEQRRCWLTSLANEENGQYRVTKPTHIHSVFIGDDTEQHETSKETMECEAD